jgi:hypothetical protein
MKSWRRVRAITARAACIAAALALAGCAAFEDKPATGMYDLRGWNNWYGDIDGEVGHRTYVPGPTARCLPSHTWNSSYRIQSGSLPPGMDIDNAFNIVGIPTERGHWIVTLELYDVNCEGGSYQGLTQELRFHITGSGRVVQ